MCFDDKKRKGRISEDIPSSVRLLLIFLFLYSMRNTWCRARPLVIKHSLFSYGIQMRAGCVSLYSVESAHPVGLTYFRISVFLSEPLPISARLCFFVSPAGTTRQPFLSSESDAPRQVVVVHLTTCVTASSAERRFLGSFGDIKPCYLLRRHGTDCQNIM